MPAIASAIDDAFTDERLFVNELPVPLLSFTGSGQEALVSLTRMRLVGEPHLAAAECRPGTASAGRVTTVRIGDETLDSGTAARASGPRRLVPFTLRMPQTKSQRIG